MLSQMLSETLQLVLHEPQWTQAIVLMKCRSDKQEKS